MIGMIFASCFLYKTTVNNFPKTPGDVVVDLDANVPVFAASIVYFRAKCVLRVGVRIDSPVPLLDIEAVANSIKLLSFLILFQIGRAHV